MTVDDLYYAAVDKDPEELRQMLAGGGAALLKEKIDGDPDEDGCVSQFTVVFSILCAMRGKVRYDILDVLVEAGVNFRECVCLKQDSTKTERPMLEYAISIWEDPKLVEYMLKNGAYPNAVRIDTDSLGRKSKTTMVWYGLNYGEGTQMLELLLKYGADPEKCCELYDEELGVYQYLPPLYYSVVENKNLNQSVCLMRYGASPQCGIDTGVGLMHNTNFKKYLSIYFPGLNQHLVKAFELAQAQPAPQLAVKQQPEQAPMPAQSLQETLQKGPEGHKLNAGSRVKSLKRCYGKMTAYAFINFGLIGIAFVLAAMFAKEGSFLLLGLPCLLVAAAIASSVQKKAKSRGQDGVLLQLVGDGMLLFLRLLLMMTIILIPLVKGICSNVQWEERKTTSGATVRVKKNGDGTYEDIDGNRYEDRG